MFYSGERTNPLMRQHHGATVTVPKCGPCDGWKLKDLIPRHMFKIPIQAGHGGQGELRAKP